jgi:hypothetical protein
MLQPVMRDLQGHVGEILPADLAKEVEDGTISEERAKELARAAREASAAQTPGRAAQRAAARRRRARWQDNHTKITSSIKGWEDGWKAKDPDYKLKAERVFERMVVLMQGKDITPGVGGRDRRAGEERRGGLARRRAAPSPRK